MAINSMKGQLRTTKKQSMLWSLPLWVVRGVQGTPVWQQSQAEAPHSACTQALRSPRNIWMGLGRRKGRETGMQDYEKPKMGRCHKLQKRRGPTGPSHFRQGWDWVQEEVGWIS